MNSPVPSETISMLQHELRHGTCGCRPLETTLCQQRPVAQTADLAYMQLRNDLLRIMLLGDSQTDTRITEVRHLHAYALPHILSIALRT